MAQVTHVGLVWEVVGKVDQTEAADKKEGGKTVGKIVNQGMGKVVIAMESHVEKVVGVKICLLVKVGKVVVEITYLVYGKEVEEDGEEGGCAHTLRSSRDNVINNNLYIYEILSLIFRLRLRFASL